MASLGSATELASTSNGKSQRTSLIINLDSKEEFTICSLINEKIEQQSLDLVLTEGENIAFRVDGPNSIHLSGYYVDEDVENDGFINDEDEDEIYSDEAEEDSQIEYDSELEDDDFTDSEEEEEEDKSKPRIRVVESDEEEEEDSNFDSEEEISDDDELSEEDDDEESEVEEEKVQKPVKKVKFESDENSKAKENPKENSKPSSPNKVTPSPAKPASQPIKAESKTSIPQAQGPTPVKKTLPSGLQIEDLKLGNGAKVSKGKTVLISYKGTLTNGKVFDTNFGSKPLKFTVGKGAVIKGMELGVEGMAVGGTRKLVIPAPLAYGNAQIDGIPRNSTLVFEIRLERII